MVRFEPISYSSRRTLAAFLGITVSDIDRARIESDTGRQNNHLLLEKLRNIGCEVEADGPYHYTATKNGDLQQPQCSICGKFMKFTDGYYANSSIICDNCFDHEFFRCDDCRAIHLIDYKVSDNINLCPECADRSQEVGVCTKCEEKWGRVSDNRDFICEDCASSEDTRCLWCDRWTIGGGLCGKCGRDQKQRHSSSFDPQMFKKLRMPYESPKTAVYGVEAEEDTSRRSSGFMSAVVREIVARTGPEVWAKSDGSLSRNGIEFVTLPMSAEYHMKVFPWEEVEAVLVANQYTRTNNCGLHIHMSRVGLNTTQQVKIGLFWYTHRKFIERFSRRRMGTYCSGKSGKDCLRTRKNTGRRNKSKYGYSAKGGSRQSVFFGRDEGIEFRQFNGTYKARTIRASIMFLEHLRSFVKVHGAAYLVTEKAKDDFLEVLRNSTSEDLKQELQERGL